MRRANCLPSGYACANHQRGSNGRCRGNQRFILAGKLAKTVTRRGRAGLYRFVVSGQDPGIRNWLDSEGHSRGLIMLRWQGLSEAQDAIRQPSARIVPIGRLRQDLPPDTPEFGPAKRAQQTRGRRREAQQRFPGRKRQLVGLKSAWATLRSRFVG